MSVEESQHHAAFGMCHKVTWYRFRMLLIITVCLLFVTLKSRVSYAGENASAGENRYTSESLGDVLYFATEHQDKSQQELSADQALAEKERETFLANAGIMKDYSGRLLIPAGRFRVTGYCPCYICSEGHGTMTSTGVRAVAGRTVAVDPRVIPYGTHLMINGHEYVAEDCGGLIKNKRIDIYFNTHREASNILFYTDVYIIQ